MSKNEQSERERLNGEVAKALRETRRTLGIDFLFIAMGMISRVSPDGVRQYYSLDERRGAVKVELRYGQPARLAAIGAAMKLGVARACVATTTGGTRWDLYLREGGRLEWVGSAPDTSSALVSRLVGWCVATAAEGERDDNGEGEGSDD